MAFELEAGDILLFHGGAWISRAIRWATSHRWNPTWANHVARCVHGGNWETSCIVEALSTVKRHSPASQYFGTNTLVRVYRPLTLTKPQLDFILRETDRMVGRAYDYFKIVLQLLDGLLGKILWGEVVVFRRLAIEWKWFPGCCYSVVLRPHWLLKPPLTFGIPQGREADPDDIDDYCKAHPDQYALAYEGPIA